ncbi:hypothetical protein PVAND_015892 [Polypedilum vanderplanki]|uniref:Uncharacterized protein n=1 Tax=Polypedilum vanderplanki TaxID=319348 RepID=A0A9J6BE82_POLVA|nr:hypothetical protein PVAND_015892 [Polypedilum vanderplanki]
MRFEKIFITFSLILICNFNFSSSQKTEEVGLDCTLSNIVWLYFNRQYTCTVRSNLKVVKEDTTIVAVDGVCGTGAVISNVTFFNVLLRTVRYVPKGLDVLLPNLIGMKFENTQLKHVSKESLKNYPNLLSFASVFNDIQYLEKDLFMYNPNLQFVSFRSNKISYIDPLVFDVIAPTLVNLWLDGTVINCGLTGVTNNANVLRTITKLKTSECANEENAPALYLFWLQQQQSTGDCDAQIAEKVATIERLNADISSLQEEYDLLSGDVDKLTKEVEAKDAECQENINAIQEENKKIIECLTNPGSPDCPSLDAIRRKIST